MSANGQSSLFNTRGMASAREMRAFKRAAEIKRLGIKRAQPKPVAALPDLRDAEFTMADEDRYFTVFIGNCPECGFHGQQRLDRQTIGTLTQFRIRCRRENCYATPWLKSSAMAIQHWKVTAALSR